MKSEFDEFESNRMRSNPDNYKWGIFYFNPDDPRIILPKRNPYMGWTLNFGNIYSYIIIIGFTGIAILVGSFDKIFR